jgi:hypothetical protein
MWVSQWDRSFGLFTMIGLILVERLISPSPQPISSRSNAPRWGLARAGREPGDIANAVGLGLTLAVGALMSFGNLPIAMLCGLYALARLWQIDRFRSWRLRIAQGAIVALGFASVWLALAAFSGFDSPGTYRTAMRIHLELQRDYWPFVVWHAWDIFTFVGLPLAATALFLTWRQWPALSFAWVVTIAVQCLLHVARGETGRVWMYVAPVIAGLAGMWLADGQEPRFVRRGPKAALGVLVVSLLGAQAIAHIGLLRVIGYGVDPIALPNATLPAELITTDIRFEREGEVQLLGYTLPSSLAPGDSATLDLFWRLDSAEPLSIARKVFVHVAGTPRDDVRIASQDGRPANWTLPTTCWLPGQVVHDPHRITVDPDAQPGDYFVLVGLYDEHTGERAFVHTARIATSNAVALPETVRVQP